MLDYVENSTIKAEDLSDVQDVRNKQITENTLVSPRILAFYRINISAEQLWYAWSFPDIPLTGISSFHTVFEFNFAWKTSMKRSKLGNQALY